MATAELVTSADPHGRTPWHPPLGRDRLRFVHPERAAQPGAWEATLSTRGAAVQAVRRASVLAASDELRRPPPPRGSARAVSGGVAFGLRQAASCICPRCRVPG
eukprot:scaffold133327_cov64-Phaeocystis_antarctica.AAC.2